MTEGISMSPLAFCWPSAASQKERHRNNSVHAPVQIGKYFPMFQIQEGSLVQEGC